jgi:1A family penicillin-binding protein
MAAPSLFSHVAALRQWCAELVSRHPGGFVATMSVVGAMFWFGMGASALFAHQVLTGVPDRSSLTRVTQMARSSVFYDHLGRPAFTIFKEQRIEVTLDQISPHLKKAMLAIEDQRFYDHQGIDLVRMAGAAIANLREGNRAQGASTITQQLARMSFLTLDKTYSRKFQEAVLAALIENDFGKEQIFELYLNKVYFGAGLYGAEAAARGYFGKRAADLTLAEGALLAGLVKAPSNYAPTANLDRATRRRTVVLQAMLESGAIDRDEFDRARTAKVTLTDSLRNEEPYGRFFKEHVRHELINRFGADRVYEGGLKVYTTIDLDMQRAADAEVQRVLKDLDTRRNSRTKAPPANAAALQAALVAIDPRTGEVRALIGGRDFVQSNFNRAISAKRQPGSAFKPFVYAAALEAGFTPATLISNLDDPVYTVQGAWIPEDDHSEATAMTMRAALKTSSNRAAVRMLEDLGINKAVDYAKRIGVGEMPGVPSLALGAGEVTLESLTSAYGVFASMGARRPPTYIKRVEDAEGVVLYQAPFEVSQVISQQTAFLMTHMLADVVNHGTAYPARQLGFKLPAAGKTGTTNDYRDAWFVGYTPRLVTGVWVGFDQPQTIVSRGYAATVAVPLWAGFMKKATADDPADWYKAPPGIVATEVCKLSGKRPGEHCYGEITHTVDGTEVTGSNVYTEYFVRGTQPEETCDVHASASIFSRIAGWVGGASPTTPSQDRAAVRSSERVEEPAAAAADSRAEAPTDTAEDAPKKKRGFWGRIFGRGDKNDEKKPRPR